MADASQPVKLESCFVICPIGAAGSDIRARSDDLFDHLIVPICKEEGIVAERAIDASRPGDITRQIIDDILTKDLVIADISGHNPNVFYELAIRHLSGKPFIHLSAMAEKVPFDMSILNVIPIETQTFAGFRRTADGLHKQIKLIKAGGQSFENASSVQFERILSAAKVTPSNETKVLLDRLTLMQARLTETEERAARLASERDALAKALKQVETDLAVHSLVGDTGLSDIDKRINYILRKMDPASGDVSQINRISNKNLEAMIVNKPRG